MSTSFDWNEKEIYAHPGETLGDHLGAVARRTKELTEEANVNQLRSRLAYLAGFCHDIGKATQDFQEYLRCQANEQNWQGDTLLKSHSKFGTQLCLAIGQLWYATTNIADENAYLDLWLAALAIRSHHGPLQDFIPDSFQINDLEVAEDFQLVTRQIQRLRHPEFDLLFEHIKDFNVQPHDAIKVLNDKESWLQWRRFKRLRLDILLRKDKNFQWWTLLKVFYSSLLQADKEQNLKGSFNRRAFPYEQTQKYVSQFVVENEIDNMRRELFCQCSEYAGKVDLEKFKVHQLTLPTGAGKTLAGLQIASILRQRLESKGIRSRIIYALPFISIIEQNFEVFSKVFGERSGDLLLAHHHLAALDYWAKNEELDGAEAALKIEGWESELIVTTFYQLFEALFGTANATNRKFAALQNAIILLDEPQALPMRYFPLFRQAMQALIHQLGWQIILMTATPPLLFEKNDPLCQYTNPNFRDIFSRFNRYRIIDKRATINSLERLIGAIEEEWQAGAQRILVVANTVHSSREIYTRILTSVKIQDVELFYLNTEVLPVHRKEKILEIAVNKPVIVVSTQLIEAGVDISLDVVFRDFAPIPSLIQSAGRCRRHDWQECAGKVIVVELRDERGNTFAGKVYDPIMLDRSGEILTESAENAIWPMIQEYYDRIQDAISQDIAEELLQKLRELQLKIVDEQFALIDQQGNKRDLLIPYNASARELLNQWQLLGEMMGQETKYEERFRLKAERAKLWRQLAQYLITPYEYRISKELLLRFPEGMIIIDQDLEKYYSKDIGLIPLKKGEEHVRGTSIIS